MSKENSDNQSTAQLGRELVEKELIKHGVRFVTQVQHGRQIYLKVENKAISRTLFIKTKTRCSGSWHARTTDGDLVDKVENETYFWVFVDLSDGIESAAYYIIPGWWIRRDIYKAHAEWLAQHGGERPVTKDSDHHAVPLERIEEWGERWDVLKLS